MNLPEIELLPVRLEHREAFAAGRLSAMLDLAIPAQWPEFPEAFAPGAEAYSTVDWPAYFFVSKQLGSIVGNGGFCGPPRSGEVEIGYEVAPAFRGRGFATQAAARMVAKAFESPLVHAVVAHTLAEKNASNAVLKKLGMQFDEELPHDEVGSVWRWRIRRFGRLD
jgi:RimJ/RimL family protein N-acetyltransferase